MEENSTESAVKEKKGYVSYQPSERITGQLFSLIDAISDLVTATGDLFVQHIELAKLEFREDVMGLVNRAVLALAIIILLFFGYCLLLMATVLLIGWAWGVPGMALAALILALVHLGVTIPQAKRLVSRMRKPAEFKRTRKELEGTKQWMNKQIEDFSLKKQ